MFKLIIMVFMVILGIYYVDVLGKFIKDEKEGKATYKIGRMILPFGYWIFPVKKKKKLKSKTTKNEKK